MMERHHLVAGVQQLQQAPQPGQGFGSATAPLPYTRGMATYPDYLAAPSTGQGHGHGHQLQGHQQLIIGHQLPPEQKISKGQGQGQSVKPGIPLLIDYRLQQSQFLGARFIFECGVKLEAKPMTIATAAVLYHRFFKEMDDKKYDIYLIGACSLYLAGKHENQHLKLRDVINVAYATIHRNELPLDLSDKYWSYRDAIVQSELLIMRVLKFQTDFVYPHKFLVHYLKTLEEWIGYDGWSRAPVARTAWSLLQDFHHDGAVISYQPQALAVAAIKLAMDANGAQVPLCSGSGRNSWQMIMYPDIDQGVQEEIMYKMLAVYDNETAVFPALLFRETVNGK